jgi:hypothetical protein
MIYKDGWLAYDAVVASHSGLTQDTTAHSLVRIMDGGKTVEQQANYQLKEGQDSKVLALHRPTGAGFLHVAADLTAAYGGQAAVGKVQREIVYLEPSTVIVYDRVETIGGQIVFQLVSPVSPDMTTGTSHKFTSAGHTLTLEDLTAAEPPGTMRTLFDFKTDSSKDFMGGFRLEETAGGGKNRFLHVLTIDGAADPIAQGPTTDSVTMTLVSVTGKPTATMVFNHDDIGGTLTIGGKSYTLGAGLEPLPE